MGKGVQISAELVCGFYKVVQLAVNLAERRGSRFLDILQTQRQQSQPLAKVVVKFRGYSSPFLFFCIDQFTA